MPGPAPKPKHRRVGRSEPLRGEWIDLEPIDKPVLPAADPDWTEHVKFLWSWWEQDPVTTQYGPADVAAILELAYCFDDLQPSEQRLRMDSLGLTPKGKRDLRWRTPAEVATIAKQPAKVARLKLVAAELAEPKAS